MLVKHGRLHDVTPVLVDGGEATTLLRHLGHDVRGGEDGLEVEPGGLYLQPLVQYILERDKRGFPFPEKEVISLLQNTIRKSHTVRVGSKLSIRITSLPKDKST